MKNKNQSIKNNTQQTFRPPSGVFECLSLVSENCCRNTMRHENYLTLVLVDQSCYGEEDTSHFGRDTLSRVERQNGHVGREVRKPTVERVMLGTLND